MNPNDRYPEIASADPALLPVANNTKWQELRGAMLEMDSPPKFRRRDLDGRYSGPDSEWFYHFSDGGYRSMQWVDLIVTDDDQRQEVLGALKRIGLAGDQTDTGFRVYGYAGPRQRLDYFGGHS